MSGESLASSSPSPSAGRSHGRLPLDAVLATDELRRRPARPADPAAENDALTALVEALARPDAQPLQELAECLLGLCRAHSAGVSLLDTDAGQPVFRWRAVAGRWAARRGGTMPRDHSPSGVTLDRREPQLFSHPERHFHFASTLDLPIAEALVVPFFVGDRAAGTLWVLAHDASRRFDGEDARLLTWLARFAALAERADELGRVQAQLDARRLIDDERTAELAGLRRLQELSLRLLRSSDETTLYESVIDAACEIMHSDFASIQRFVPERGELKLLAHRGFEPAAAAAWKWIAPTAHTCCGMALAGKERVLVPDVESFPPLAGTDVLEAYRGAQMRAIQSTPLLSRQGQVLGMLSTHWRRVTHPGAEDLRKMDVLASLAADLLQRAQADQALREADVRKTEFLAMLAHELRNPLASLHNALQIVREAGDEGCAGGAALDDPQAVRAATAIMDRQLAQLVRLVDDLLDISRISRGRIELRKERIDLATVIQQALETMAPMCKQLEQTVTVELPDGPILLDGDATRLVQVFGNLLNNACKYSERGRRVRLAVRVERPAGAGAAGQAIVSIRDEGIGIAVDQLGRIFEMFAQVDTSLERAQGGLGIGLTLVKTVVELHGGRIEARSDGPGHGSEFEVRLPLAGEPAEGGEEGGEGSGAGSGSGHRILVVDDCQDAADSLALLLRNSGHETRVAYGGAEALQVAEEFRPNVVLLDLGLPQMDGYETCRRLRATPACREAFIVAQTGRALDEDKAQTEEAGFRAHLVKPVALEDLAKLLADVPACRSDG